jgi:hypothetical protein
MPYPRDQLATFIDARLKEQYYRTETPIYVAGFSAALAKFPSVRVALDRCIDMANLYKDRFAKTHGKDKHVFGTVASRVLGSPLTFVTTARGKKSMEPGEQNWTLVQGVDHDDLTIQVGGMKATLNAPLLHWLFTHNPDLETIVHFHTDDNCWLMEVPWYPPGTVADSQRLPDLAGGSFQIVHHGVFLLFEGSSNVYLS